jgi:hypothetical protein
MTPQEDGSLDWEAIQARLRGPDGDELRQLAEGLIEHVNESDSPYAKQDALLTKDTVGAVFKASDKQHFLGAQLKLTFLAAGSRMHISPTEYFGSMQSAMLRTLEEMGLDLRKAGVAADADRYLLNDAIAAVALPWLQSTKRLAEYERKMRDQPEMRLWLGAAALLVGDAEATLEDMHAALKPGAAPKVCFWAVQNIAWALVSLGRWDEAVAQYDGLAEDGRVERTRLDAACVAGYIRGLRRTNATNVEPVFCVPPEDEWHSDDEDDGNDDSSPDCPTGASAVNEAEQHLALVQQRDLLTDAVEQAVPKAMEGFLGQFEKMMDASLARHQTRLIAASNEAGDPLAMLSRLLGAHDWVQQLANPGVLANAESLFATVSRADYSTVVAAYSTALEGELNARIFRPLREHLSRHKQTEVAGLDEETCRKVLEGRCTLGAMRIVLESARRVRVLQDFFSRYSRKDCIFLLEDTPPVLKRLLPLRNASSHGEQASKNDAESARSLVLPMLERMAQVAVSRLP